MTLKTEFSNCQGHAGETVVKHGETVFWLFFGKDERCCKMLKVNQHEQFPCSKKT
jgi:hypothetical protein